MTDLLPWEAPDGVEVLIEWLSFLGETRDDRPSGAVLPYRMVNLIDGTDDGLVERGLYSIHTFAATKPLAQEAAKLTHRRMGYLVGHFAGQQRVTISNGREVQADNVVTVELPHWQQWDQQNSLHRFVATYRVDLRFVAA